MSLARRHLHINSLMPLSETRLMDGLSKYIPSLDDEPF